MIVICMKYFNIYEYHRSRVLEMVADCEILVNIFIHMYLYNVYLLFDTNFIKNCIITLSVNQ